MTVRFGKAMLLCIPSMCMLYEAAMAFICPIQLEFSLSIFQSKHIAGLFHVTPVSASSSCRSVNTLMKSNGSQLPLLASEATRQMRGRVTCRGMRQHRKHQEGSKPQYNRGSTPRCNRREQWAEHCGQHGLHRLVLPCFAFFLVYCPVL